MTDTIAICVCTCMRPKMLAACLESLSDQVIPPGYSVSVIVVDNDPASGAREAVVKFMTYGPFIVRYVHEPKRGIATARNAALETALGTGADWIAFIDDDETAAPDWIAQLMSPEYLDTPILVGPTIPIYPDKTPFWCQRTVKKLKPGEEGRLLMTATTGNVRFSADLVRAGLRFNENLRLMGGEDQELFSSAHNAGCQTAPKIDP